MKKRCGWTGNDELMNSYHDLEWGIPVHNDKKHFEFLVLDAFQAGLSWRTILYRREGFRRFMQIQKEFGSFDKYIWQFTGNNTIQNKRHTMKEVPATSKESDAMSKDMKKRGFTFVGSTICYAYMQAAGMVNDHLTTCFRYKEILKKSKS